MKKKMKSIINGYKKDSCRSSEIDMKRKSNQLKCLFFNSFACAKQVIYLLFDKLKNKNRAKKITLPSVISIEHHQYCISCFFPLIRVFTFFDVC